jgi:hypothetical protein
MSNALELIKSIAGKSGQIYYKDHDFGKISVKYGLPPVSLVGLDYVLAYHTNSKNRLVMSLTGGGAFVTNQNLSGIIEIGILQQSVSVAAIQALALLGASFPFIISDSNAALSSVVGTAAQLIQTPRYSQEASAGVTQFQFAVDRLAISHGMKDTLD